MAAEPQLFKARIHSGDRIQNAGFRRQEPGVRSDPRTGAREDAKSKLALGGLAVSEKSGPALLPHIFGRTCESPWNVAQCDNRIRPATAELPNVRTHQILNPVLAPGSWLLASGS